MTQEMFAHISIGVSDMARALRFYDSVMATLGYNRLFGNPEEGFMAYGPKQGFFIINTPLEPDKGGVSACNDAHYCFNAPSPQAVDEFYKIALAHGAADGGAPGLRPHYAADYYAAFVYDPDGHKLEALARITKLKLET
jgi:catechol 2,3-dioxygenase-like lactoylglutathione lyase family enzyme